MTNVSLAQRQEYNPTKISFLFMTGFLFLVGYLHLATPLLTVLFTFLVLDKLSFLRSKGFAITLMTTMAAIVFYFFTHFAKQALDTLPAVMATSIPVLVKYANSYGIDLPFSDGQSLMDFFLVKSKDQFAGLAKFAQIYTKEFLYLLIGMVIASSIYVSGKIDLMERDYEIKDNLYSLSAEALKRRFINFYSSFKTVMGAQIVIAAINTFFTAVFILGVRIFSEPLPYPIVLIIVTLLCGILPLIGNIISNWIIVSVALTSSVQLAILSLIYLVVLHKFEYFLNSKIIGGRINNPMWMTLLALILGERLMGIPGMILAPVVLNYLKLEATQVPVKT